MKRWQEAKSRMISAMNGLVYEHPETLTFPIDETTRKRRFDSFCEWVAQETGDELFEFFIMNGVEGFYDNKTIVEFHMYDDETVVPVGMKMGKALQRYFIPVYNAHIIEKIRIEASRLVQENKITGKLCISVHPLDYLSVSENQHNWRSCHALDGEYRSGNLSYMVDTCTVVAYLKSENDTELPRFDPSVPWNNKKWRCLIYLDDHRRICWAGRQYPFSNEGLMDAVVNKLLIPHNFFDKIRLSMFSYRWISQVYKGDITINNDSYYLRSPHICYHGEIQDLHEYIIDDSESMQFNDLLNSSYYTPEMIPYGGIDDVRRNKPMKVGGPVKCICCGDRNIEMSETMRCKQCTLDSGIELDEIGDCECCGERIFMDYDYSYNGRYFCAECFRMHVFTCKHCGEMFYVDDECDALNDNGDVLCTYCRKRSATLGSKIKDFFIDYI